MKERQETKNDYENLSDALFQLDLAWSKIGQSCLALRKALGQAADNSHRVSIFLGHHTFLLCKATENITAQAETAVLCGIFLQTAGLFLQQSKEYAELFAAEVTE